MALRQYALKEFGPMVMTVFDSWGIHSSEDIGNMVFNLIGAGIFGKTEEDSIEDFKNVYDFQEAFVKPFAPEKPAVTKPRGGIASAKACCIEKVISNRLITEDAVAVTSNGSHPTGKFSSTALLFMMVNLKAAPT